MDEKDLNRLIHMSDQAGKAVELQAEFYKKFFWTLVAEPQPMPLEAAIALVVGYQKAVLYAALNQQGNQENQE